jgi:predicted NUDIX family phosphoesterase
METGASRLRSPDPHPISIPKHFAAALYGGSLVEFSECRTGSSITGKRQMATDLEVKVAHLEDRAGHLLSVLRFARRAFVIEFAGTPKSGKSTSIEAVRHFFSRHGFRVHVLIERASTCPIPMKGHLFFNTWCAASMLAELLAHVETETDIIVVDRGIMDALVWLISQRRRGEVTDDEACTIESFLLLDRWRGLIDLAVIMTVSPEEAMQRENSVRITAKPGSVMNPDALKAVTDSVSEAVTRYESKFPRIITHDTAGHAIKESLADLATKIADSFEQFLNPDVLVVPKQQIASLVYDHGGAFDRGAVERAVEVIQRHGHFMRREQAEESTDQVQVVSCGYLQHDGALFVFDRKDSDPKSRLYGRATILQASHVCERESADIPKRLELALLDKLSQSLFLSRVFPTEAVGYCWDGNDEGSSRHFGVVYRITVDNQYTASDLRRKEFRKGRGHGMTGDFYNSSQLVTDEVRRRLETWSHAVLYGMGIRT